MDTKFFVETIGNVNDKIIREYVQNQLNAMDKMEKSSEPTKSFLKLGRKRPSRVHKYQLKFTEFAIF